MTWVAVEPITKARADYPFDREVRRLAEDLVVRFRERIGLLRDVNWPALQAAIEQKNVAAAVEAIPWRKFDEATRELFEQFILESISVVGRRAAEIDGLAGAGLAFQAMDQRAVDFAKRHAAELVVEIGEETRKGLRRAITLDMRAGLHPYRIMEDVRSMVGLLERHVVAVDNYRRVLQEKGLPEDRVDKLVQKKVEQLHKWRAENIARTEALNAAAEARNQAWLQAVEQGIIDVDEVEREWMVAVDERLCPKCAAMSGTRASLIGTYPNGLHRPPAHPSCRCAEKLVEKER